MLGMGATMTPRDFVTVVRDPLGLLIGVVLQIAVVPLVAVTFVKLLGLPSGWAVGLVLVSVVPGGAFSNLLTYLGRGNAALSISITAITTVGCIVTIPLVLRVAVSAALPEGFSLPALGIIREIGLFLLLPLLVGMFVHRVFERAAPSVSRWSIRLSVALIIIIAIGSTTSGRIRIGEYGLTPPLLIAGFGLAIAVLIPHLCRLLRRYDDDTVAIGIEVTVRNVGVGLLMITFFFPGTPEQGHVLYSLLFYAGISPLFSLPLVLLHRYGKSPVLLRSRAQRPSTTD